MLTWKYAEKRTGTQWEQEVFRTLYTTILTGLEGLKRRGAEGMQEILVTPRVAVALQCLPEFYMESSEGECLGYLGEERDIRVRRDLYSFNDFVVLMMGNKVDIIDVDFGK